LEPTFFTEDRKREKERGRRKKKMAGEGGEDKEYFGVVGRRGLKESGFVEFVVPPEPPEEEVVTPPVVPPTRKPRMFTLLEQILYKLDLLVLSAKERRRPKGLYYNSGIKTITTATAANLDQPAPPDANYPEREKVFDTLHRTANITILNEGPGDIYMLTTSGEAAWNPKELKAEIAERVIIGDAYEIALRADVANTKYRAVEYFLESTRVSKAALPSLVSAYQQEWDDLWEVDDLPPKATTSHTAYTVPTGYKLLTKGGFASCDVGVMQRVWLCHTPGLMGDFRFDYLGSITFVPSVEIPAGDTLTYYFYNNHVKKCRGTISLIGVLEKT